MQNTDKSPIYTAEQFHLVRDLAGNFFEQIEGQIVWRQTGQAVEEEILEAIFNHQEVTIAYMTTKEHALIISNLNQDLRGLDKSQFRLFIQDPCICIMINGKRLKARIPDATVTPQKTEFNELGEALNPVVVFEVVSPSSTKTDYIDKLKEYKTVATLQSYLVVEQKEMKIVQYDRLNENEWTEEVFMAANEMINIRAINISLNVAEVYANVWE